MECLFKLKILLTGITSRTGNAFENYIDKYYPNAVIMNKVSLRDEQYMDEDWSGYDAVIHMAGVSQSKRNLSSDDEEKYCLAINRDLTEKVAKKAKLDGVKRFIYLSTMMVYGESAPIGEAFTIYRDTVPRPVSAYGKSKLAGECVLKLADERFQVVVVRESVVYGEHFNGEFCKLLRFSRYCPIFPRINSTKSYIYEGNLCELLRLLALCGETGIICPQNTERITTSELYLTMRHLQGHGCFLVGRMQGILKLLSHFTRYVNATFNDMKYAEELSLIPGFDYQVFSLEESILRCLN